MKTIDLRFLITVTRQNPHNDAGNTLTGTDQLRIASLGLLDFHQIQLVNIPCTRYLGLGSTAFHVSYHSEVCYVGYSGLTINYKAAARFSSASQRYTLTE